MQKLASSPLGPDQWDSLSPEQRNAVLSQPALKPPDGVEPNFDNPPNRNGLVLSVTIVLVVLTTTFVLTRLYSKLIVARKIYIEDVLALLAFGSYIGAVWTILRALSLQCLFVHQWDVTLHGFLSGLYAYYLLHLFYAFTMLLVKTAILRGLLRVFAPPGTRNFFFWAAWAVLGLNAAFFIVEIFFIGFTCRPIQKWWTPMLHGYCLNEKKLDVYASIINPILDLAILAIPQRIIWTLNMRFERRVGVSVIFSAGILACAASLGRIIVGRALVETVDRTYDSGAPALFVLTEMSFAFLVFCLPTAPQAFNHLSSVTHIPQLFSVCGRFRSRHQSTENRNSAWPGIVNQKQQHDAMGHRDTALKEPLRIASIASLDGNIHSDINTGAPSSRSTTPGVATRAWIG
ncbi:hypothetical protein F5X98DRAFT_32434 [Xylaria grammica]|nr:hypothetical protein F5X98DRAFT_32434 [Xylaria grammica]